jgi:hypothetical protein
MEPDSKRSKRSVKPVVHADGTVEDKQLKAQSSPSAIPAALSAPASALSVHTKFMSRQVSVTDKVIERLLKEDSYAFFQKDDPCVVYAEDLPGLEDDEGDETSSGEQGLPKAKRAPPATEGLLNLKDVKARHIAGAYLPPPQPAPALLEPGAPRPLPTAVPLLQYDALERDFCSVLQRVISVTPECSIQGTLSRESRRLHEACKEAIGKLHQRMRHEAETVDVEALKEHINVTNDRACVQGSWRYDPSPLREYVRYLEGEYAPAHDLPPQGQAEVMQELNTDLREGYFGHPYSYEDDGLSEHWMRELQENESAAAAKAARAKAAAAAGSEDCDELEELDSEGIAAMVAPLMQGMLAKVVDRVRNDEGTLKRPPLQLGPDLQEVPVRGCDRHTRANIVMVLREAMGAAWARLHSKRFIEHLLLPAVNRQVGEDAYWLKPALEELARGGGGATGDDCKAAAGALELVMVSLASVS